MHPAEVRDSNWHCGIAVTKNTEFFFLAPTYTHIIFLWLRMSRSLLPLKEPERIRLTLFKNIFSYHLHS